MTFDSILDDGRLWAVHYDGEEDNAKEEHMKSIVEKLKEHSSPTPSKWRERAEFRRANKSWLRFSQHVAMMMLDKMESLGLTQKGLASRMECSQQYISKILKGQENLSLETICRIEDALDLELLPKEVDVLEYS